jgi:DNA polymerase II
MNDEKNYEGFIVTSSYSLSDNKVFIHLFGRLSTKESFEARIEVKPYFFIKKKDLVSAKKIIHVNAQESNLKTTDGQEVVKITIHNPKDSSVMRKLFEDNNIACYESDIKLTRRFLIDKNLFSYVKLVGKANEGERTDKLFINCECISLNKKKEEIKNTYPKLLSIDIETNKTASVIYSVSLYSDSVNEVIIVRNELMKEETLKNAIIVDSEDKLLRLFIQRIIQIDPDIITGWHVIDFDFNILLKRAKAYGINFSIGRNTKPLQMRIESSFFRDSSAVCEGRLILDGIHILKSSYVRLQDFKLNTAAKHFLKDSKTIQEDDRFGIIEKLYKEDPQAFIDYNLKDSKLVYDILLKSDLYELTIDRSLLTGLHMDEVKASIASFDSLYLRELRKSGHVALSTRSVDRSQGLGGYVLDSKPGIYEHVLVLDFKSLYPSIMRTFCIDPLAYQGTKEDVEKNSKDVYNKNKFIISPNDAVFEKKKGLLPKILKRMWDERELARKRNDELTRYAIKIHMNSLYGVLASPNSRFHIRNLSDAITSFAQFFIKMTVKELEKDGFDVIYGDTDSVFVATYAKDSFSAFNIGKNIEEKLNIFFKKYILNNYNQESVLELEFEKQYERFFLPKTRGSESGAKKRYAGLKVINDLSIHNDVETKMDFTGLEFVRSDWTSIAKEFQLHLLKMVFSDKDPKEYIRNFVKEILDGKHDELLVYRKSLRKDVEKYTKTTPPHVKAARLLDKIESSIISYVLTKEGPQPVEKISSSIDYDHYIQKQIKPIADSILECYNTNFDDVLKKSEQTGLGSFM